MRIKLVSYKLSCGDGQCEGGRMGILTNSPRRHTVLSDPIRQLQNLNATRDTLYRSQVGIPMITVF